MSERLDRRQFITQVGGGLAAAAIVPNLAGASSWTGRAPVRVGVVGAGRQGRAILGELGKLAGAEVVAVCDADERRLASGLRRVSGAEGFTALGDMLGSSVGLDAVAIATPTPTHKDVAVPAIEAGKHVYCEAPLAHTIEDCLAINTAARSAKGVVAAGLQGRSNPVYDLARGFFRSDSVRDMVSMRAQRHQKTSWVSPSRDPARSKALNWRLDPEVTTGLAGEWGTHQFDVFHWYTGQYPVRVMGHGDIRLHDDGRKVHDTIACTLIFPDGAALQYGATLANSYNGTHELFHGSNAAIKLAWSHGWMFKEADAPTQGWEVYANRQQFHNDEGITLIAGATKLSEQGKLKEGVGLPNTSLYYALENWLGAIAGDHEVACPIGEAVRATAVGIAAHRATRDGVAVDVEMPSL
ncbi:MAG: Gfo/Idh/MocA family oxidoreductase [Phycisphaerales bacterium JB059]